MSSLWLVCPTVLYWFEGTRQWSRQYWSTRSTMLITGRSFVLHRSLGASQLQPKIVLVRRPVVQQQRRDGRADPSCCGECRPLSHSPGMPRRCCSRGGTWGWNWGSVGLSVPPAPPSLIEAARAAKPQLGLHLTPLQGLGYLCPEQGKKTRALLPWAAAKLQAPPLL